MGIGRKESFLIFGCLYLAMVGTSTFLILPKCYITYDDNKQLNLQINVDDQEEIQYKEMVEPVEDKKKPGIHYNMVTAALSYLYITFITRVGLYCLFVCLMVLNATFINISVISWRSVLLVEETGGPWENYRPVASHWQTLSQNVVHLAMIEIRTHNIVLVFDYINYYNYNPNKTV